MSTWVPGSRRYTDPTTLLIPVETWAAQRDDFCTVTGTDADAARQLQQLEAELLGPAWSRWVQATVPDDSVSYARSRS